jgi:hypothetical protein
MRRAPSAVGLLAAIALVACTGSPSGSPAPTAIPSASPGATIGPLPTPADHDLSTAELKYRLIDAFSPLTYCDPDVYPIAHGDEGQKAGAQFSVIEADAPTFSAILDRLGLVGQDTFGADQKLAIYREWKRLNAVILAPAGPGRNAFDLVTETDPGLGQGTESKGTIDGRGAIVVESARPAFLAGCPICLARGTPIDTPLGPVAVDSLGPGDPVWTVDVNGTRVAGVVIRTGHAAVPETHQVVHLVLADGRSVVLSPGHPLPDGRHAGDLRDGDPVDGSIVTSATLSTYGLPFTFDLLPSGATGLYWAGGILLGSTLR